MQKVTFYAAPGVAQISAGELSARGTIKLSESEALYDLAAGRLLRSKPKKNSKTDQLGGGSADGGS